MKSRTIVLSAVGAVAAGCSALPHYALDYRILPEDLSSRVQCELKLAAKLHKRQAFDLNDYSVGYTIAVRVETEASPNVKLDWTIPVPTPKSFSIGISGGVTDNIMRDGGLQFEAVKISGLTMDSCPTYLKDAYERDVEMTEMAYGSFGLVDWIGRMSEAVTPESVSAPNKADYTLRFLLTANASIAPTYKIVNLSTAGGIPLKRINTHTLTVALAKNKEQPPPLKVCVTNMGGEPCDPKPKMAPPETPPFVKFEKGKPRTKAARRVQPPSGVDPTTRQQIEQQLEFLRLRDILRP